MLCHPSGATGSSLESCEQSRSIIDWCFYVIGVVTVLYFFLYLAAILFPLAESGLIFVKYSLNRLWLRRRISGGTVVRHYNHPTVPLNTGASLKTPAQFHIKPVSVPEDNQEVYFTCDYCNARDEIDVTAKPITRLYPGSLQAFKVCKHKINLHYDCSALQRLRECSAKRTSLYRGEVCKKCLAKLAKKSE
jgi:hypothetical protein